MNHEINLLKQRIFFGTEQTIDDSLSNDILPDRFSLEEIMESLIDRPEESLVVAPENIELGPVENINEQPLLIEEEPESKKPKFILYEIMKNTYIVYVRENDEDSPVWKHYIGKPQQKDEEHNYGLFVPAGVMVRRVPQNVLGNGVLGRAFIYSSYIEILDSLHGNAYQEVLTHEVLHILHPEKKEMDIRQMTRNYIGCCNTVYH